MQHPQLKKSHALKIGALILGAFATSHAASAAPKDNLLIEPGKRLGRVFIGDTSPAVRRRLGKPARTFKLGPTTSSELWRSGKYTLEVVYKRGKVAQIEATNPVFQTDADMGIEDSMGEWMNAKGHDNISGSYYSYPNKADQGYYDWKESGLALETTGEEEILTIIVHRAGTAVIPDKGGKLVRDDEHEDHGH